MDRPSIVLLAGKETVLEGDQLGGTTEVRSTGGFLIQAKAILSVNGLDWGLPMCQIQGAFREVKANYRFLSSRNHRFSGPQ